MIKKENILWEKVIQCGGNILFSLLIFVIMFDPNNLILNLKDILFISLLGYNIIFYRPDFSYLPYFFIAIAIVLLGYILASVRLIDINIDVLLAAIKSFSPLILLLWVPYYNIIKLSLIPAFVMCLFLTTLYITVSVNTLAREFLWNTVDQYDNVITLTFRSFYGITILGMYHKAMICLMFALGYFCYSFINEKGKKRIIMFFPFICGMYVFLVSGTRSSMMIPFFMFAIVCYQRIRNTQHLKYFIYPILALFGTLFLMLIIILASETSESSNIIKYAHLSSYAKLFNNNPLYMIIGQGPGTSFYSEGFGKYTSVTEWTYLELLRNYGILCLPLLYVFFKPIKTFYKYKKNDLTFVFLLTYIAYLFIAGTNPLLISSTGMLMILSAYSYEYTIKNNTQPLTYNI